MKKLILLLKKIHLWAIFILLEIVCLTLYFSSDTYMLSKYLSVAETITINIDSFKHKIITYFSLVEENKALSKMNVKLLAENQALKEIVDTMACNKSLAKCNFPAVIALNVIRNEFLNSNNFIVLDGGEDKGVKKGMAALGNSGIVGYISSVSKNFSVVVSLLSMDNFVSSAKIKGTSFSGTLLWDGKNHNIVQMVEVPKYATMHVGDTILTTSYSSVFPENIPIGQVVNFKITEDTFYSVNVRTFTDFSNIDYVYLLELENKAERDSLEKVATRKNKVK